MSILNLAMRKGIRRFMPRWAWTHLLWKLINPLPQPFSSHPAIYLLITFKSESTSWELLIVWGKLLDAHWPSLKVWFFAYATTIFHCCSKVKVNETKIAGQNVLEEIQARCKQKDHDLHTETKRNCYQEEDDCFLPLSSLSSVGLLGHILWWFIYFIL